MIYPWIQKERYLEAADSLPAEYPKGSEGHKQWTYNPRTKESREYAKTFLPEAVPNRKKPRKTSNRKKED